jgi:hypothetical protein
MGDVKVFLNSILYGGTNSSNTTHLALPESVSLGPGPTVPWEPGQCNKRAIYLRHFHQLCSLIALILESCPALSQVEALLGIARQCRP